MNSEGWYIKGTSAGWKSTLESLRIEECYICYCNAIEYSKNKSNTFSLVSDEYDKISFALVSQAGKYFASNMSRDGYKVVNNAVNTSLRHSFDKNNKETLKRYAIAIRNPVLEGFINEKNEYNTILYPSLDQLRYFIEKGACTMDVLTLSANLYEDSKIYSALAEVEDAITFSYSYYYDSSLNMWRPQEIWQKNEKTKFINEIMKYHQKAKELDPNYVIPQRPSMSKGKDGCYIATCVYGSYNCPQVWVLRRFRDYQLNRTIYGKCFIKVYYFISPKIVKIFGNNKHFKNFSKNVLDKLVNKLIKQGVKDTEYNDIY